MAIPSEFLDRLRDASDISDIIGSYVPLKRSGGRLVGLCPFHSEKTPSFTVFPDTSSYYCFGCQAGGDVITFIRGVERLDYVEAVKYLAAKAGLEVPENGVSDGLSQSRRRIKEMNREAARFFHRQLYSKGGTEALGYLKGRGLADETITHFGLGFSPDSWDSLSIYLSGLGFRADEIISANLGLNNRFDKLTDRFRNRIMFPIIDLQGSVIAFGGRTMEKDHKGKKYLNTSDTLVYKKTNNLYALNWAKNAADDTIVVTEGFMDVIAMWQAGFANVVASQGTAFTEEQARLLSRYAKRIVLAQDGDEAGQTAIRRSIPVLKATGADVRVMIIPESLDPDEYIQKYGAHRMKKLLDGSESELEFRLGKVRGRFDVTTDDGRVKYLSEACMLLAELSPLEREVYSRRIAEDIGVDKTAIETQIEANVRKRRSRESREQVKTLAENLNARGKKANPERTANPRAARAEEALLLILFRHPDKAGYIMEKLPPEKMITSFNRRLYETLLTQCKQKNELSLIALSQSFTPEEMGEAARILNSSPGLVNDPGDADKCIAIILEEGGKPSGETLLSAGPEELQKYLDSLKKRR